MLIQDRIQLIIKANKETPSSFADKVGIKRSNLSHVLSGRNNPSLDFLSKVITTYPNVNASWLVTGETREGDFKEEVVVKKSVEEHSEFNQVLSKGFVEKIVVFYRDKTFSEYSPSEL
ncbi:MAG: helix-turn-helix transcriptional regulator [Crocinitomicaceae bacterium]